MLCFASCRDANCFRGFAGLTMTGLSVSMLLNLASASYEGSSGVTYSFQVTSASTDPLLLNIALEKLSWPVPGYTNLPEPCNPDWRLC
jgi:hypothetical protein